MRESRSPVEGVVLIIAVVVLLVWLVLIQWEVRGAGPIDLRDRINAIETAVATPEGAGPR